jgi:hypothetical protein
MKQLKINPKEFMNFKVSVHAIFSGFLFASCFASEIVYTPQGPRILNVIPAYAFDQKVLYNHQGINTIARMIFHNLDEDAAKEVFFVKGLAHFCKEKEIQEGDMIGEIFDLPKQKIASSEHCSVKYLNFTPHFPVVRLTNVDIIDTSSTFSNGFSTKVLTRIKRIVIVTREMEKFVNDMIEKGKSVNQDQTANN